MAMGLKTKTIDSNSLKGVVYSDFNYSIGPRFQPITKVELVKMKSVTDFNTKKENKQIESFESTALIVIADERQTEIRQYGDTETLNTEQLELLNSLEVSSHFLMRTEFMKRNTETGELEFAHYGPHYTIVPEKQAKYDRGSDALLAYISRENKENTANLNEDQLQFAMLHFTVSKTGTLTNMFLDRSSGNVTIDKAMLSLIQSAPGKWIPAENEKGKNVDQELVITFGVGGC